MDFYIQMSDYFLAINNARKYQKVYNFADYKRKVFREFNKLTKFNLNGLKLLIYKDKFINSIYYYNDNKYIAVGNRLNYNIITDRLYKLDIINHPSYRLTEDY